MGGGNNINFKAFQFKQGQDTYDLTTAKLDPNNPGHYQVKNSKGSTDEIDVSVFQMWSGSNNEFQSNLQGNDQYKMNVSVFHNKNQNDTVFDGNAFYGRGENIDTDKNDTDEQIKTKEVVEYLMKHNSGSNSLDVKNIQITPYTGKDSDGNIKKGDEVNVGRKEGAAAKEVIEDLKTNDGQVHYKPTSLLFINKATNAVAGD